MKKLGFLLIGSLLACNTYAKADLCNYKDFFSLESSTHPDLFIASSSGDQNIHLQVIEPRRFSLQGTTSCHSGYAKIKVQYDANHWCTLEIKDGPFKIHPDVGASCNGLRYLNMVYEGRHSHAYTLYFD